VFRMQKLHGCEARVNQDDDFSLNR
jgi:hypothetical protein